MAVIVMFSSIRFWDLSISFRMLKSCRGLVPCGSPVRRTDKAWAAIYGVSFIVVSSKFDQRGVNAPVLVSALIIYTYDCVLPATHVEFMVGSVDKKEFMPSEICVLFVAKIKPVDFTGISGNGRNYIVSGGFGNCSSNGLLKSLLICLIHLSLLEMMGGHYFMIILVVSCNKNDGNDGDSKPRCQIWDEHLVFVQMSQHDLLEKRNYGVGRILNLLGCSSLRESKMWGKGILNSFGLIERFLGKIAQRRLMACDSSFLSIDLRDASKLIDDAMLQRGDGCLTMIILIGMGSIALCNNVSSGVVNIATHQTEFRLDGLNGDHCVVVGLQMQTPGLERIKLDAYGDIWLSSEKTVNDGCIMIVSIWGDLRLVTLMLRVLWIFDAIAKVLELNLGEKAMMWYYWNHRVELCVSRIILWIVVPGGENDLLGIPVGKAVIVALVRDSLGHILQKLPRNVSAAANYDKPSVKAGEGEHFIDVDGLKARKKLILRILGCEPDGSTYFNITIPCITIL